MTVLRAEDLRVTYSTKGGDVPAVRGVSFEIDKGEVLGLAGESGCGKSTIAGAILRLHSPNTKIEGTLELEGEDVLSLKPGRLRADDLRRPPTASRLAGDRAAESVPAQGHA